MKRAAWAALSAVSGLGPARFRRVVEAFGDPLEALEAGPAAVGERVSLPEHVLPGLAEAAARLERTEAELAALEEGGVRCLTWDDTDYPGRLLTSEAAPPVLWWAGAAGPDCLATAAAVVGSRAVSQAALSEAGAIAASLAARGIAVVSGLAEGVDAAAHRGALDSQGPTVGVCGCGLMTALNGRGLGAEVAEGGAICSELAPTTPLLPRALFARDRIIAGLAAAVIVAAARPEGGAVHTAKCALAQGRPVFAVEWPRGSGPAGNRALLAAGARPLGPGEDVRPALADAMQG